MGVEFLSSKREAFEHRRDKAKEEELLRSNLFSNLPEEKTELFRCEQTDNTIQLHPGQSVVIALKGEREIAVYLTNRLIGRLTAPADARLRLLLGPVPDLLLWAVVVLAPSVGQRFSVRIPNPGQ